MVCIRIVYSHGSINTTCNIAILFSLFLVWLIKTRGERYAVNGRSRCSTGNWVSVVLQSANDWQILQKFFPLLNKDVLKIDFTKVVAENKSILCLVRLQYTQKNENEELRTGSSLAPMINELSQNRSILFSHLDSTLSYFLFLFPLCLFVEWFFFLNLKKEFQPII